LQELTFSSIILHDVGGSSIKEQCERGPETPMSVLKQLGCEECVIEAVCRISDAHHDLPDSPSLPFWVLYDADKLVMFSPEVIPLHFQGRF